MFACPAGSRLRAPDPAPGRVGSSPVFLGASSAPLFSLGAGPSCRERGADRRWLPGGESQTRIRWQEGESTRSSLMYMSAACQGAPPPAARPLAVPRGARTFAALCMCTAHALPCRSQPPLSAVCGGRASGGGRHNLFSHVAAPVALHMHHLAVSKGVAFQKATQKIWLLRGAARFATRVNAQHNFNPCA